MDQNQALKIIEKFVKRDYDMKEYLWIALSFMVHMPLKRGGATATSMWL